ncbi:MAG: hypothetical protein GWN67_13695 [Phycisphaerae bacterium]|nr:M3 family metallopeptidase [Phycisphaerae bacterium]NIP53157.1 M3 family metallopeptidase [Phycisphaerae bacterium]NIS52188.1 M3 family metallopeptidase [Phycisphaerae bacterium]NIU09722.1 M3 family metallopeptidase [Phycisphaerae bacterium]NIU57394.1 hypothetical protein [Phycisphaerae bacterium]
MKKLSDIFGGIFAKGEEPAAITEPFKLIADRTVAEVCGDFDLQEEAKAHLSGEPMPHEFVDRLVRAKLYQDAMRFLAYGLPMREAVWWASLCVRSVPACCNDDIAAEAMQAAEAWVKNPTEENRDVALTAGGKNNFEMPGAPAAWTAMAAGWSNGAAASDDETLEVSVEHLTAHAASGAIILAAGIEPDRAEEVSLKFLETGVQIAQGKIQISA